jgi:quinol monooxygenase YgiN
MIVRQVKLTFKPEKVSEFRELFKTAEDRIRNFPGCTHLELLKDIKYPNIFFTVSHWNSEADLEAYRQSELFKSVWYKTKTFFFKPAEAWSLRLIS